MDSLIIYLFIINFLALFMMRLDKHRAIGKKHRIPETTLFGVVFLGGGLGGTLAMLLFRHKTRHWYFLFGFPLITITEYIVLALLFTKQIM